MLKFILTQTLEKYLLVYAATFGNYGQINLHNMDCCPKENLHWMKKVDHQHRAKLIINKCSQKCIDIEESMKKR